MPPKAIYRCGPSPVYNCHGLTFASRRTRIWTDNAIKLILTEDNYAIVEKEFVLPGDIVVYYNAGDAEHSGIVVEAQSPMSIRVVSKFGSGNELVHWLYDVAPYDTSDIKFYRIRT
jgi:hypothetical protein